MRSGAFFFLRDMSNRIERGGGYKVGLYKLWKLPRLCEEKDHCYREGRTMH